MTEGTVVIVDTGQAGTIVSLIGDQAIVLLANGDMWHGKRGQTYEPQSQADLDAALLNVDKFKDR